MTAKISTAIMIFVALIGVFASGCSAESTTDAPAATAIPAATAKPTVNAPFDSDGSQAFTGALQKISGAVPLTLDFDARVIPGILAATWDFGDGDVSSEMAPNHTFSRPGNYDVQLTAMAADESLMVINYIVEVLPREPIMSRSADGHTR
ncbi:MAG: PKD domain-containing protein, partial [Dehalococcoidia bacterium]